MSARPVNLLAVHRMINGRLPGIAEYGADGWHRLLQAQLARVDRELKPKDERVQMLYTARRALLTEMAVVINTRSEG